MRRWMKQASDSSPRFCTLLESYYPVVGGMETQARNMAQGFAEKGIEQIIVTRRTSPDLPQEELIDDIPVYRAGPTGRSSRYRWLFMLSSIPTMIRLRKKYDVILVPGFRVMGITAVLIAKLLKKKAMLKAECIGELSGEFFTGGLASVKMKRSSFLFNLFLKARNHWLIKADSFVSMYSEMTEEYLHYGVSEECITVIPQSVNAELYAPAAPEEQRVLREKLHLPLDFKLIVYTGRIVSYKGVPLMLEVWQEIRAKYPDAAIIIVGEGGVDSFNCEQEVRDYVKTHQMEKQVIFTGAVKNVDEYMKACDIFALPTQNDAFPLCLLEAMASQMPIITTTVGALKDVIHDRENGLVVQPGSAEELKEAIETLLSDEALGKKLGETALKQARQCYTRSAIVDRYIELAKKQML